MIKYQNHFQFGLSHEARKLFSNHELIVGKMLKEEEPSRISFNGISKASDGVKAHEEII